ncbi:hypothetical protein RR46_03791, partial [Papilio xuthus]
IYVSVQFVRNPSGKVLALVQGYTFYMEKQCSNTQAWRCTKGGRCKARFTLSNDRLVFVKGFLNHQHKCQKYIVEDGIYIKQNKTLEFLRNTSGRTLALVQGYTFYKAKQNNSTQVWRCTVGRRCRARFTIHNDGQLMTQRPKMGLVLRPQKPPLFPIRRRLNAVPDLQIPKFFILRWVLKENGKRLAILDGHTFYLHKHGSKNNLYSCTRAGRCKANFSITKDFKIKRAILDHSHPPPQFLILKWVFKPCGRQLGIVNGYTFYLHKHNTRSQIWSCTKGGGCRARLILSSDADKLVFAKSRYGKDMVLLGDYTYSFVNKCISKSTTNWRCSSHNHKGCLAKVVLDSTKKVIAVKGKHNHKPFDYKIHKDCMIRTQIYSYRQITFWEGYGSLGRLHVQFCEQMHKKRDHELALFFPY